MNFTEIRRLVKLVETSQINELEIEEENSRVRILKHPLRLENQIDIPAVIQNPAMTVQSAANTTQSSEPAPEPVKSANEIEVNSPMVGTFYRAPSPEAPAYVEIGDHVRPGQVLCIIEAMKLMNEIESEVSGRIVDIAIENAQPVEYNGLLFKIEQD